MKKVYTTLAVGAVVLLSSCAGKVGFQGGNIARVFTGITSAEGISPKSIKLEWNDYPGASKYYVYSSDTNNPIYEASFNTYVFQPTNPDPSRTYLYSVSAQDPLTGLEEGDRTKYTSVKLLPNHNFKTNGKVVANSNSSVLLTWTSWPGVSYKVYVAERMPTGETTYNFESANLTKVGESSAVVDGLLQGREYCAIVVASYADNNNDTPDGVTFTGDIGAYLNNPSNGYIKGASGNFSDGKIAASQHCARTKSSFKTENMKALVQKGTLSNSPTFYLFAPGDSTEDNASSTGVRFDIYRVGTNGGNATKVATYNGTGPVTVSDPMTSGKYKFFAVATSTSGETTGAQSIIEIQVGKTGVAPKSENERGWVYVRAFSQDEIDDESTAYIPEKQQAGFGSQQAGQSVAVGDFNCDGKNDVAYGVPYASKYGVEDHLPSKQGRVVIYYDLKQSESPETASRMQVITFDISSAGYSKEVARNLMLGTGLFVGNFNRDNQFTNQNQDGDTLLKNKFRCDDLVIASGRGPMFVLYGKRDVSGNYGGLSYTNETTFDLNPSGSCDPSTNVCTPALYYVGANAPTNTTRLGRAFTSGDFNGDGYLDLAVSTSNQGIWVFRGSEIGLMAPKNITVGNEVVNTNTGQYTGFPYVPTAVNQAFATGAKTPATNVLGWGTGLGFGASLGTFHNAYYDPKTKRMRSVLLIGNSTAGGGGRIHACIPKTDTLSADGAVNFDLDTLSDATSKFAWDCTRSLTAPVAPNASTAFGSKIVSIENALRYKPSDFPCPDKEGFGNCSDTSPNLGFPGAFAVSDPTHTTDQKIFVYYGVNAPLGNQIDRAAYGVARNVLLNNLFNSTTASLNPNHADGTTAMSVVTGTDQPCEDIGGNGTSERCQIQKIKHPSGLNCGFGMNLDAIPGSVVSASNVAKDTILAVSCPYRAITSSDGIYYSNVGSVQIYYQNSYNNSDLIKVDGISRASDGFSNSLTLSLDFLGDLHSEIRFGIGGIAGGPVFSSEDGSDYNSNSDIFIGAPGFSKKTTVNGKSVSIVNNGAVYGFYSHGGMFRRYPIAETGPNPSVWHEFSQSFSQESDYKFHQVVSVGDLNADGIGDVAVRINRGDRNQIRFYSGKTAEIGFDRVQYQNFSVSGDLSAGMRFVPAGKVGQGQFPFFFVTGKDSSYLYASGIGGVIQGQPAPYALPLLLKKPTGFAPQYSPARSVSYLKLDDASFFNNETVGVPNSTLRPNASFAHGDFNGDGYEDFAMGMNINSAIEDMALGAGTTFGASGAIVGTYGTGRVLIWYGGGENGFQVQPDTTNGGFPLSSDYFTGLSSENAVMNNNIGNRPPCSESSGSNCKIQAIMEPQTTNFGESILSVPFGKCTVNGKTNSVNALLVYARKNPIQNVGGVNNVASLVYIYKPRCLSVQIQSPGAINLSGLYADTVSSDTRILPPLSSASSTTFGYSMTAVEGVRGAGANTKVHLVISDQSKSRLYVYPVNSTTDTDLGVGGTKMFIGSTSTDWTAANQDKGLREVNYTTSMMMKNKSGVTITGTSVLFAQSMAPAGDLNGDGFTDLAVSMPQLTRKDTSGGVDQQGGLLVLYGGPKGFQTHDGITIYEPARNSSCYVNTTDSICKPSLVYLPQITNSIRNGEAEMIYLPQDAMVNWGTKTNDGLGTILIGTPGKDSSDPLEKDRILNAGGFHALP